MRYLAAYLLLQIGGNASPSAADIKKLLGTVSIEAEDDRLNKLIAELKGKSIDELIAEGSSKLASVPSGGGGGGSSAPAAGGAAPAAAAEEKKEEKEEEKEESDDDMGFGLFD
ncbi:60s acidic ribosomal protein-domain-containing protein [Mycena rebaudengoi]|nr:60s acidic ribosomal protein-domain-containing protein [Mycena rebaudengoi]